MKFNICLIRPEGYTHSAAFAELAEVIGYGLQDLGHEVGININQVFQDAKNLVIGCHLLPVNSHDALPKSSIIINTEQIFADDVVWKKKIIKFAQNFPVWDYSERNIQALTKSGVSGVSYLKLGYHSKISRLVKPVTQDIDVLFYGSVNQRRKDIIDSMRASGLNVQTLFGVYGPQRDRYIERSKVVLNIHYYDSKIFEIVRVFYLMNNSKAVLCEVDEETSIDPAYSGGFVGSAYQDLVEICVSLVGDENQRTSLEQSALATIKRLPQAEILEALLDDMGFDAKH
jgi:hypothetical protein